LSIKIEYQESEERFGMSGPWIGKLKVDNDYLKYEFLDKNFIVSNQTLIILNRFEGYAKEKYFFGLLENKTSERVFRILVLNKSEQKCYLSKISWQTLYLTKFNNGEIYYTNAFHDGDRIRFPEKSILFNRDNFVEIDSKQMLAT
jgi:hypothetical protein